MIPKKIHYCWFGGAPLPYDVKQCIASWKKYCPEYEIVCWNETNFDVNSHPFMKVAYEAKAWAFVSDYARLKIVYEQGGIYMDTDVELCKPLDSLLAHSFYAGRQQVNDYVNTGLGFGAEKESAVVRKLMEKYDSVIFDVDRKNELQCPVLNTQALFELGFADPSKIEVIENAVLFPAKYLDPYASGKDVKNLLDKDTISIHHYSASWTSGSQRRKRQIARLIGEDKILWLKNFLHRK